MGKAHPNYPLICRVYKKITYSKTIKQLLYTNRGSMDTGKYSECILVVSTAT